MQWGHLATWARQFARDCLDAILPAHEHTRRTQVRRFKDIPHMAATHELLGSRIITLMDYRRPEVKDLIRSLKYDGNRHAARLAALALADFLHEEVASIRDFSPRPIFIIPLPLHANRLRERGFNQLAKVTQELPLQLRDGARARTAETLLVRTRDTPHQTSLSRRDRIANMRRAFTVAEPQSLRRSHVFLIDDVTTTGASLVEAGKALERCGAEVILVALARA